MENVTSSTFIFAIQIIILHHSHHTHLDYVIIMRRLQKTPN